MNIPKTYQVPFCKCDEAAGSQAGKCQVIGAYRHQHYSLPSPSDTTLFTLMWREPPASGRKTLRWSVKGSPQRPIGATTSDPRSSRNCTRNALVCKHSHETRLEELIDQHIATLHATADAIHAPDHAMMRKETVSRQAILHYRPQSESEVNEKLTYIAAYILNTGNVLTPQEMDLVLGAPARA